MTSSSDSQLEILGLFRGFDPLEDAIEYGRKLLPLFREAARQRRVPRPRLAEARS